MVGRPRERRRERRSSAARVQSAVVSLPNYGRQSQLTERRQYRGSPSPGTKTPAACRLRLHRRRRRWRGHAPRELPNFRRRVVPAKERRRYSKNRSQDARPRGRPRAPLRAGASRQQQDVLSAGRSRRGRGCRRRGNGLYALDAVWLPRRRGRCRHQGAALVSALPGWRARRRDRGARARDEGWRDRALRHHRHGCRRAPRA